MTNAKMWYTLVCANEYDEESRMAAQLVKNTELGCLDLARCIQRILNSCAPGSRDSRPNGFNRVKIVAHIELPFLMDTLETVPTAWDDAVTELVEEALFEPTLENPSHEYGHKVAGSPDGGDEAVMAWLGRTWPDGTDRNMQNVDEGIWDWKVHAVVRLLQAISDPIKGNTEVVAVLI